MASLSVKNVRKSFGSVEALKDISIDINSGEFLVLVGPSGCGKSTLLNLIAGLEKITAGDIFIDGQRINEVSPKDRDIAMVFQSYALYPNMNVRKNVSFGLETRKVPASEIEKTVQRVAEQLKIEDLLDRKPSQLSGGQRQRVAMGRALARDPSIFLFDEPLSNLDAKLRVEMRTEIKLLHQRIDATIVYVTHDQVEAMTLADRIAVMKDGAIQQFDLPQQVYDNPVNRFVAGFMGSPSMNFIQCQVVKQGIGTGLVLDTGEGDALTIPVENGKGNLDAFIDREVTLGIRPEQISGVSFHHIERSQGYELESRVRVIEPTGADTLVCVYINGREVICRVHPEEAKGPGEIMTLMVDMSKAVIFKPETGERIV